MIRILRWTPLISWVAVASFCALNIVTLGHSVYLNMKGIYEAQQSSGNALLWVVWLQANSVKVKACLFFLVVYTSRHKPRIRPRLIYCLFAVPQVFISGGWDESLSGAGFFLKQILWTSHILNHLFNENVGIDLLTNISAKFFINLKKW